MILDPMTLTVQSLVPRSDPSKKCKKIYLHKLSFFGSGLKRPVLEAFIPRQKTLDSNALLRYSVKNAYSLTNFYTSPNNYGQGASE